MLSLLSLFSIVTVSVKVPKYLGSKVTWKVTAVPLIIVLLEGCWVTEKWVPVVRATVGVPVRFKFVNPELLMVNVWVIGVPPTREMSKPVPSLGLGEVYPFGMGTP